MSWAVGYDENWKRDVGYGVPSYCDHPDWIKHKQVDPSWSEWRKEQGI